jgi:hypothetical protein
MRRSYAGFVGLDIGGANTKAARLEGTSLRAVSRSFEVWRQREALAEVLANTLAAVGSAPDDRVALTMTAELSDAFRSKREGVDLVIDAVEAVLPDRLPLVLTTRGQLVSTAAARGHPIDVAAANWVATALEIARLHPDALMIDIGSTTVDLIPVDAGLVRAGGTTDLERLQSGELVYTGVLRTNLAAIASRVPVHGRWCAVASELFAISADMHLVLGHIAPAEYNCATPDGRAATREFARERLARLVCADLEMLGEDEVDAIAAYICSEQLRQIETAARRVSSRCRRTAPVVAIGAGAFLAREVASRIGRPLAPALPTWESAGVEAASAAALAGLLARQVDGW